MNSAANFKALRVGDVLPVLEKAPITREQLKLYAEASGDFNPIHLDDAVAQKTGLPSVIAHGMLSMAFMGEFIETLVAGQYQVESFQCRFKNMTFPGDVIKVHGTVKTVENGSVTLSLSAENQRGEVTTTGLAVVRV